MPTAQDEKTTGSTPARGLGPSPWLWMALACAFVAASGAVRVNQEQRFAEAARDTETPPFPMKDLPAQMGNWQMIGDEIELEPETQQIAGCTDYMYRNYNDERTGVTLRILVAFGPASKVFYHSPLVCFPANGFKKRGGPWRRLIPVEDEDSEQVLKVPFDALAYGKSSGGIDDLQEVFYSFWHDGRWSPTAEQTDRQFRHRPAMIKIQVERPIVSGEIGAEDSPIEDCLQELVTEIERRLSVDRGLAES